MSSVIEATYNFVGMCREETITPMPRHTDVAVNSKMELPGVYVELSIDDIEYVTGEFGSKKVEVGRYAYGSSNYAGGLSYLLSQAGYHNAMNVSYFAAGTALAISSIAAGVSVVGAPLATALGALSLMNGILGFYQGEMKRDARERYQDAARLMDAGKNYGVTNNYTLFGALHNGYGVFTW